MKFSKGLFQNFKYKYKNIKRKIKIFVNLTFNSVALRISSSVEII